MPPPRPRDGPCLRDCHDLELLVVVAVVVVVMIDGLAVVMIDDLAAVAEVQRGYFAGSGQMGLDGEYSLATRRRRGFCQ